jgi:PIN domain nuclease of toxin-antitoxin system
VKFVLDASAALAVLNEEPGADYVRARLEDSVIGAVNVVEVGSRLADVGIASDDARRAFALLHLPVIEFGVDLVEIAVALRPATRQLGLSLADRACLALAIRQGAVALTSDRAWTKLDVGCEIELIR